MDRLAHSIRPFDRSVWPNVRNPTSGNAGRPEEYNTPGPRNAFFLHTVVPVFDRIVRRGGYCAVRRRVSGNSRQPPFMTNRLSRRRTYARHFHFRLSISPQRQHHVFGDFSLSPKRRRRPPFAGIIIKYPQAFPSVRDV